MPLPVLFLVLGCAVLHASWNAWVKSTGSTRHALGAVSLAWCVMGSAGALFVPAPNRASYPYLLASVLVHQVYIAGLARLYRGDSLSRVYVLMRAIPPVLVTLGSAWWLREYVSIGKGAGIALVLAGVFVVSPPRIHVWRGLGLPALAITILSIASYTLIDGVGVRKSGSALGYGLWLCFLQGGLYVATLLVRERISFLAFTQQNMGGGFLAGAASLLAYTGVLYCAARAPLGLVAALRESSVLVASFLASAFLKERLPRLAWVGALSVFAGAVCMEEPWRL